MPEQPAAHCVTETYTPKLGLNRDAIKCIAMLTMLMNHTAHILLEPGTLAYNICLVSGYFTAITMCYFLVEGYGYTRNKKKYALRLLGFAVVSQVPFGLAFGGEQGVFGAGFNMMFTLLLCFALVHINASKASESTKSLVFVLILFVSVACDWSVMAPVFTRLFIWAREGDRKRQGSAFVCSVLGYGLYHFVMIYNSMPLADAVVQSLLYMIPVAVASLVLHFCYNGKRMETGRTVSKWFFYLFYPCHLIVLVILRDFVLV